RHYALRLEHVRLYANVPLVARQST
ncbi:MAG: hypothetical protein RL530_638, partial [Actinomycetota bacterium]